MAGRSTIHLADTDVVFEDIRGARGPSNSSISYAWSAAGPSRRAIMSATLASTSGSAAEAYAPPATARAPTKKPPTVNPQHAANKASRNLFIFSALSARFVSSTGSLHDGCAYVQPVKTTSITARWNTQIEDQALSEARS